MKHLSSVAERGHYAPREGVFRPWKLSAGSTRVSSGSRGSSVKCRVQALPPGTLRRAQHAGHSFMMTETKAGGLNRPARFDFQICSDNNWE